MGSSLPQFARNHIAGNLGTNQQHALPFHPPSEAAYHGFGHVFLRDDINFDTALFDSFFCGRTDGSDAQSPSAPSG
jgi:hypothetical protein